MFATKVSLKTTIHTSRTVYNAIGLRLCSTNQTPGDNKQSNREYLHKISNELSNSLPKFFSSSHCFHIYHKNIVFEDNIRHVKTIGIQNYFKQIAFVKFWAHIKYSHKTFNVLKITEHPEDSTVRVRWRVVGAPGLKIIFMFWKYKLWNSKQTKGSDSSEWTDGFSIFSVGSDGLVHKHVVQKIMPDEDRVSEVKANNNIGVKLAFFIGLVPELSNLRVDLINPFIVKLCEMTSNLGPFG